MTDNLYRYFSVRELSCKHTGLCRMQPAFMLKLNLLRERMAKRMILSSAYRDPSHPEEVRKREDRAQRGLPPPFSAHSQGIAVDVLIEGADAIHLLELALDLGFNGIGVAQKGGSRFIHLDTRLDRAIWSY
jgi:zinc D-Ala-D-Ala carboxypeptidase